VALTLQSARRILGQPEAGQKLQAAIDELDETIRQIRTTVFAISQPVRRLAGGSLRAEVLHVVEQVNEGRPLQIDVEPQQRRTARARPGLARGAGPPPGGTKPARGHRRRRHEAVLAGHPPTVRRGRGGAALPTRVFVLDDHEVVRRGLRELFDAEADLTVVGEAATAEEALARLPATQPDVAVLDVRLPDGDGVEVCRDLRSAVPELKCLILTSFADDEALFSAILAGAGGYVLKQIKGGDLVNAVRRVAAGESLLDPSLTRQVMERLRGQQVEDERLSRLTAQERNILKLIADGKTNRQIADELYLAEKTVKNYVSSLLSKMGFARRTEAAVYAARLSERRQRP
jgi:two-component system response regulator DevR